LVPLLYVAQCWSCRDWGMPNCPHVDTADESLERKATHGSLSQSRPRAACQEGAPA
jgi:hypothetical protein